LYAGDLPQQIAHFYCLTLLMSDHSGKHVAMPHMATARIVIVLLPIIWGTTFAVVQQGLAFVTPMAFVVIRFAAAAIAFLLVSKSARQGARLLFWPRTPQERRLRIDMVILGVAIGAGYIFQTIGLLTTTTSKSAFLTSTAVIWTPIVAHFVGREKLTRSLAVAVGLTIIGIFLMTRPYTAGGIVVGDALTVACALAFGVYIVWIDRTIFLAKGITGDEHRAAVMVTSSQVVAASLIFLLVMPLLETPKVVWNTVSVSALLYTGVIATGLTAYLQTRYQHYISPTAAAVIYMLEPVAAMLIAEFFLTEQIGFLDVLGGLLIILGVIIAQVKSLPFLHPANGATGGSVGG
jgi:drug/metabolite transporter (DMT)-like permease